MEFYNINCDLRRTPSINWSCMMNVFTFFWKILFFLQEIEVDWSYCFSPFYTSCIGYENIWPRYVVLWRGRADCGWQDNEGFLPHRSDTYSCTELACWSGVRASNQVVWLPFSNRPMWVREQSRNHLQSLCYSHRAAETRFRCFSNAFIQVHTRTIK